MQDGAANAEISRVFHPKGIHSLEFDFYHTDDTIEPYYSHWSVGGLGSDNLNGNPEIFAAFLPNPVDLDTWCAQPIHNVPIIGGRCGIRFNLRSFFSSRVTIRQYLPDGAGSYQMSYLTEPYAMVGETGIISGLRTSTTDYNKYKFEIDFYLHLLSVWVNGECVVDRLPYDSAIEQYFQNGFKMVIHFRHGTQVVGYFKYIRAI
jgi:hypothetical protein